MPVRWLQMDVNGDGCVDFGEFVSVVMLSRAADGLPRVTSIQRDFISNAQDIIGILEPTTNDEQFAGSKKESAKATVAMTTVQGSLDGQPQPTIPGQFSQGDS